MFEVLCPSGLRGQMRGMKVKDEAIFADRKLTRTGGAITALLNACWLQTIEVGPYQGPIDFSAVAGADRVFALIQLRTNTLGDDFKFPVDCGRCEYMFTWGIKLSDLTVLPMSDTARQCIRAKQPYTVELASGLQVLCRVTIGEDEEFIASMPKADEAKTLLYSLARRVAQTPKGSEFWDDRLAFVEDLELADSDELWDKTDEIEGGIDTFFDVKCPQCGNIQRTLLPFSAGFFSSRKQFSTSGHRKKP